MNQHCRLTRSRIGKNLFGNLENSPLASKQDGSSKNALDYLTADALVQTEEAFFSKNGEEATQRGLVLVRTGLQTALDNTESKFSQYVRESGQMRIHVRVCSSGSDWKGNMSIYKKSTIGYYLLSLERAPRRKKSQSLKVATAAAAVPAARNLLVRRAIKKFLSCSKAVYWMIGLITRMRAGPIPRQRALDICKYNFVKVSGMHYIPRTLLGKKVLESLEETKLLHDGLLARVGTHSTNCL